MKTSLNEIREIEKLLGRRLSADGEEQFKKKMFADPQLQEKVNLQRVVTRLIRLYHNRQLRKRYEYMYQQLTTHPSNSRFQIALEEIFH